MPAWMSKSRMLQMKNQIIKWEKYNIKVIQIYECAAQEASATSPGASNLTLKKSISFIRATAPVHVRRAAAGLAFFAPCAHYVFMCDFVVWWMEGSELWSGDGKCGLVQGQFTFLKNSNSGALAGGKPGKWEEEQTQNKDNLITRKEQFDNSWTNYVFAQFETTWWL